MKGGLRNATNQTITGRAFRLRKPKLGAHSRRWVASRIRGDCWTILKMAIWPSNRAR